MSMERIVRHLMVTKWMVNRAFPPGNADRDRQGDQGERDHAPRRNPLRGGRRAGNRAAPARADREERAVDVFSHLRIWDTERNNGVLIYLLLSDRDVEIVADRGVDAKVGPREWERICRGMEAAFRQGDFEGGVIGGIREVTRHLAEHFPPIGTDRNELPDKPVVL